MLFVYGTAMPDMTMRVSRRCRFLCAYIKKMEKSYLKKGAMNDEKLV